MAFPLTSPVGVSVMILTELERPKPGSILVGPGRGEAMGAWEQTPLSLPHSLVIYLVSSLAHVAIVVPVLFLLVCRSSSDILELYWFYYFYILKKILFI